MFFKNLWKKIKSWSLFKKSFVVYCIVLLIAVVVLLSFLWSYLDSYQKSLPRYYAESHVKSLKNSDVYDAFLAVIKDKCVYEKPEEAANAIASLLLENEALRARKDAAVSTDDAQLFNVFSGNKKVASFRLKRAPDGKYGFKRWAAEPLVANQDAISRLVKTQYFTVPEKALLSINGYEVDKTTGVPTEDPFCSPLEESSALGFLKYEIEMPFSSDEYAVLLDGKALVNDGGTEYNYPDSARLSVKVNAPLGAEVFINGKKLPESFILENEVAYPLISVLDASLENAPKTTVWSVSGLSHAPETVVVHKGKKLSESYVDDGIGYYLADDITLSDYTLIAPEGSIVTVNGINITDDYIVSRGSLYDDINDYASLLVNPITNTEYSFKGLIAAPDIKVSFRDEELSPSLVDGVYQCKALPDKSAISAHEDLALEFTKTLMAYMYGGRENISDRMYAALAYTKRNSSAYTMITDTYSGVFYNKPMTITYNSLYVDGYISYADNAFYCVVHYDVYAIHEPSGKTDTPKGEYKLTFIKENDEWLIYSLLLY